MLMSTKAIASKAEEKETVQEVAKKESFTESSTQLREEAGAIALSAEAKSNTAEVIDAIPGADKVSEVTGEDKKRKSEPGASSQSTTGHDDEIEFPGIQNLVIPPKKVMVRKVRVALQKEIQKTKKKVRAYEKHPTKKSFELSQAVDLLRKLYGLLQEITYKSTEFIRNIWIHIAQGKSVREVVK